MITCNDPYGRVVEPLIDPPEYPTEEELEDAQALRDYEEDMRDDERCGR